MKYVMYYCFIFCTLFWQGIRYAEKRFEVVHNTSSGAHGVFHPINYICRGVNAHRRISLSQLVNPVVVTYHEGHKIRRHFDGFLKIIA